MRATWTKPVESTDFGIIRAIQFGRFQVGGPPPGQLEEWRPLMMDQGLEEAKQRLLRAREVCPLAV